MGALLVRILVIAVFGSPLLSFCQSLSPDSATTAIEAKIVAHFQPIYDRNRQQIFRLFHPIGHATGITVDSAAITEWAGGQPTARGSDVRQFAVNYTIYWSSPLHPDDGVTQVKTVYEVILGQLRVAGNQVVSTNGETTSAILGKAGPKLLGAAITHGL
jgi:hypothetical protein